MLMCKVAWTLAKVIVQSMNRYVVTARQLDLRVRVQISVVSAQSQVKI